MPDGNRTGAAGRPEENADDFGRLIHEGLSYVPAVARRYLGNGPDLDELIAAGHLGVMQAAIRFDPSRKLKFITYADWWIRKAIVEAIEALSGPLRYPRYRYQRLRWLRQAQAQWSADHGESASYEELASITGIPAERVRRMLSTVPRSVSLDQPTRSGNDLRLGDSLTDPRSISPQDRLARADLALRLRRELASLSDRERAVIRLRFGMAGERPLTLRETARIVGLSRERVRQIELGALLKIRREI